MPSAAEHRKQAEALFRRAREAANDLEALSYTVRGVELEAMADELERGQVQQHGTQQPAAPPQQPPAQQQPAQQQQQSQPPKKDD